MELTTVEIQQMKLAHSAKEQLWSLLSLQKIPLAYFLKTHKTTTLTGLFGMELRPWMVLAQSIVFDHAQLN